MRYGEVGWGLCGMRYGEVMWDGVWSDWVR